MNISRLSVFCCLRSQWLTRDEGKRSAEELVATPGTTCRKRRCHGAPRVNCQGFESSLGRTLGAPAKSVIGGGSRAFDGNADGNVSGRALRQAARQGVPRRGRGRRSGSRWLVAKATRWRGSRAARPPTRPALGSATAGRPATRPRRDSAADDRKRTESRGPLRRCRVHASGVRRCSGPPRHPDGSGAAIPPWSFRLWWRPTNAWTPAYAAR